MDSTNTIHSLLHHLSAVLARRTDQILQEKLGIGLAQYKILISLQANPVNQQRQLAVSLGQSEASISRQIKLLLGKNMLKTQTNPLNRREHITTLTSKGYKITKSAQQILQAYQISSLDHINNQDQKYLKDLLNRIQS